MCNLLVLFIVVPILELVLLIEIGAQIGLPATLGLILVTGTLGAILARSQGMAAIASIQGELAEGRLPGEALLDGLLILVAGAVLLTPGVLTDVFGFLCLVPPFRAALRRGLRKRFERAVRDGRVHVSFGGPFAPGGGPFAPGDGHVHGSSVGGRVLDVDAEEVDEEPSGEESNAR